MRVEPGDLVTDRVEEVGLAQADSAVDEQRVVGARRQLGDGLASGLGELVRVADHERVERVAGGETWRRDGRLGFIRLAGGRRSLAVDVERDARIAAEDFAGRGLQRLGVVLVEPIARVRVRRGDLDVIALDGRQPAWAEPRVERRRGHLGRQGDEHAAPQGFEHR